LGSSYFSFLFFQLLFIFFPSVYFFNFVLVPLLYKTSSSPSLFSILSFLSLVAQADVFFLTLLLHEFSFIWQNFIIYFLLMALDLASTAELDAPSKFFLPSPTRYDPSNLNRTPIASCKSSEQSLFIKKRQSRIRSKSVFPAPKLSSLVHINNRRAVSFELDPFQLPHKTSFYDLYKTEDEGMDSDSSTSSASVFSDPEDDNDSDDDHVFPKFYSNSKVSALQFPTSCTSAIDSYFAMPTNNLPTKQTPRQPLKSLSKNSLFLTEPPQLSPDLSTASAFDYPPCSTGFSWGMPSFGHGSTRYFPRHCKVRRTHSMFERPEKVLLSPRDNVPNLEASPAFSPFVCKPSILSHEKCPIKTYQVDQDQFRRIDSDTLCEIMDGCYSSLYDRHVIVDCRFEYEYEGGHIDGAININSKERLREELIVNASSTERVLLIFHCEYSAHRGPQMAMQLRNFDREANMNRYPMLYYPDIIILTGGYSSFFKAYANRCFPQKYVGMNDNSHADTCEREMDKFRRSMKTARTQSLTSDTDLANHFTSDLAIPFNPVINSSFKFPTEITASLERKSNSFSSPTCIKANTLFNDSTPTINKRRLGSYSKLSAPAARVRL
jgi:rhodanese-related sulfurtransferase